MGRIDTESITAAKLATKDTDPAGSHRADFRARGDYRMYHNVVST